MYIIIKSGCVVDVALGLRQHFESRGPTSHCLHIDTYLCIHMYVCMYVHGILLASEPSPWNEGNNPSVE